MHYRQGLERSAKGLVAFILALIVILLYRPALNGEFLFDYNGYEEN